MDQFDPKDDQNRSLDAPRPAPAPVPQGKMSFFTTPLSQQGWPVMAVYVAAVIGLLYLLNPTAGILELLPDNLPIVGNLDEGAAFLLLWFGLMEYFESRKRPPSDPS